MLIIIIVVLGSVAYISLADRHIMASLQRRVGPTFVGIYGLLQPIADAIKLLSKELIIPTKTNAIIFMLAPTYTFILSLGGWITLPFINKQAMTITNITLLDISLPIFLFLLVTSFFSYGIICIGWSSNNQYALISIIRYIGQTLSYELSFGLLLVSPIIFVNSFNMFDIVIYQLIYLKISLSYLVPLNVFTFLIVILIKTNRIPFDLAEAESELIAGYQVEHSGVNLLLILVAEYAQVLIAGFLMVLIFWSNFTGFFELFLKLTIINFIFISIRAAYPRVRYDQLLFYAWKYLFPLSLILIFWNILLSRLI